MYTKDVTRIEIIDHTDQGIDKNLAGRVFMKSSSTMEIGMQLADDKHTLKIFLTTRPVPVVEKGVA